MKFYRFYTVVCAVVLLMASLAGGPVATAESRGKYAQEDLSTDYSEAGAILVEFSENGVQAGSGVAVADGRVTFSQAGTYVLSGAYSGQLFVEIDK